MNFAVIGKNINYSLSPRMHLAHFKHKGINASYEIINITDIDKEIVKLRQLSGFNITIPYKYDLLNYCKEVSDEAHFVKAVNCVKVINNDFYGYNTDIYGFYQLLQVNQVNPNHQKVLIIGAGGAGRAVYYCLNQYYQTSCTVSNRTINKARELTNNIIELDKITLMDFDLVINCTNVGVYEYASPIPIHQIKKGSTYIDLNYQNQSQFLEDAKKLGARTINGLDMLVYQGAKSFEIWFNQEANIEAFKHSLRKE